jgi:Zn-dependent protease
MSSSYFFHLAATIALGIGIPVWGGAGYIIMFDQFSRNVVSAIFCAIAAASFSFQLLFGLALLHEVRNVRSFSCLNFPTLLENRD